LPAHLRQSEIERYYRLPVIGIHWPLIDEDLAVGPLLKPAA
jgi:hypothetical protein